MKKILLLIPMILLLAGCNAQSTAVINSTPQPTANITTNNVTTSGNATDNNITTEATQSDVPKDLYIKIKLSELRYLPLNFNGETFSWDYDNVPDSLRQDWTDKQDIVVRGAIMEFQYVNGLPVDGIVGDQTLSCLSDPYAKKNSYGYSFVMVNQKVPQTIQIWHDGVISLSTRCNTGISVSKTPNGLFPVYLRYRSQTMEGTNPDGSHYKDAGVPYVSYFYGGCAIHGFIRQSYGTPQSLGCVELKYSDAKVSWDLMQYGTLVDIR